MLLSSGLEMYYVTECHLKIKVEIERAMLAHTWISKVVPDIKVLMADSVTQIELIIGPIQFNLTVLFFMYIHSL